MCNLECRVDLYWWGFKRSSVCFVCVKVFLCTKTTDWTCAMVVSGSWRHWSAADVMSGGKSQEMFSRARDGSWPCLWLRVFAGKRNIWPRIKKIILHEAKTQNGKNRTTNHVVFDSWKISSHIYHVRIAWARNLWKHILIWKVKIVCKECASGLQGGEKQAGYKHIQSKSARWYLSVWGMHFRCDGKKNECGGKRWYRSHVVSIRVCDLPHQLVADRHRAGGDVRRLESRRGRATKRPRKAWDTVAASRGSHVGERPKK